MHMDKACETPSASIFCVSSTASSAKLTHMMGGGNVMYLAVPQLCVNGRSPPPAAAAASLCFSSSSSSASMSESVIQYCPWSLRR